MESLRIALKDWTDVDLAQYAVATSIGLMPEGNFSRRGKSVFWTNNPIGDMLHNFLERMVQAGILEKRDEPDFQYRWNPGFRGSWE